MGVEVEPGGVNGGLELFELALLFEAVESLPSASVCRVRSVMQGLAENGAAAGSEVEWLLQQACSA